MTVILVEVDVERQRCIRFIIAGRTLYTLLWIKVCFSTLDEVV